VAWGLLCVWVGVESVSTWLRWLKKELIEGRRVRVLGLSLMPCSTGDVSGVERRLVG
jgi:hypothetical protein